MKSLSRFIILALALVAAPMAIAADDIDHINIDTYFDEHRTAGRKIVTTTPHPVMFDATIMQEPRANKTSYLQKAMSMSSWSPMPQVGHSMFVASAMGKVVPVYVEKDAANHILKNMKVGDKHRFEGFHIYSYSKGPAILVVGAK